jgi:flagellar biosynthesis protein FliR
MNGKTPIAVVRRPVIFIVATCIVDGVLSLISRWIDEIGLVIISFPRSVVISLSFGIAAD